MKGKVIKAVLIIFILLLGSIYFVPHGLEAQGQINIQIVIDNIPDIDVSPGSPCTGYITGRVISDELVREVRVELQASTDQGWPCTIDPAIIIVPPQSEVPFTVEIAAAPCTSYYSSCTFTLGGSAGYYPGSMLYSIPTMTGSIKIKQFSLFVIRSSGPLLETQPGGQETFEVDIVNFGNAREMFNIEIKNIKDLNSDGFTVTLSQRQIEVPENSNATIEVKVTAPSSMDSLGTHDIEIQAEPENLAVEGAHAEILTLEIKVNDDQIIFTYEFQIILVLILVAVVISIFLIRRRCRKNKLKQSNN